MICKVCQHDTAAIIVDGASLCSVCHTPYEKSSPARSIDIARKPVAETPEPKTASSVHARVRSNHILDLSASSAHQTVVATPPEPVLTPEIQHHPHHTPALAPHTQAPERHIARFTDRIERSKHITRSEKISRFGVDIAGHVNDPSKMYDKFGHPTLAALEHGQTSTPAFAKPQAGIRPSAVQSPSNTHELPHMAATQHEAMARLITPAATATQTQVPRPVARMATGPALSRAFAVTAAILIMGGYIWLQNYPKLAIQTADARSGISASLPAYVPSSYALAATNAKPGAVTLNFTSPSAQGPLTISQQKTTWDPSSLLYNYISKAADDYAAVQGEGLTIYMFGQNQATWVNRGIWFSITGASRLSRDDILKIAYSL